MNRPSIRKLALAAAATCGLASGLASANSIQLNVTGLGVGTGDGITDTFAEFGLTGTLATSIYDLSDGSPVGKFIDTNNPAVLAANGVPGTYGNLAGTGNVSLVDPTIPGGANFDALNPLDPIGGDLEGFNAPGGWGILIDYTFEGNIGGGQPNYTGGGFTASLYDPGGANDGAFLFSGNVTGSDIAAANLDIFFEIQEALPGFLFIDSGSGFIDASTQDVESVGTGNAVTLRLDTNVDPPVPTPQQLAVIASNQFAGDPDGAGPLNVGVRQANLDSSLRPGLVPAPAPLALLGLGLAVLGLRGARRNA